MAQNPPPSDPEVAGRLHTLGVVSLCQWDVLVFLYRHQSALLGAADLARLLGYPSDSIVVALDSLEALELVSRSRGSPKGRVCTSSVSRSAPRAARPLPGSRSSMPTVPAGSASPSSYGGIAPTGRHSRPPSASSPPPTSVSR